MYFRNAGEPADYYACDWEQGVGFTNPREHVPPQADLSISNSDGVTSAIPGQTTLIYTIVASNNGPNDDPSASLTDTFPADLTCTYFSVAAGGASGNTAAGSGDLGDALSMPAASSVTYTASCTIDPGATGTLSNTATVSGSVLDLISGNNSATDGDTLGPVADVSITKDDGVTAAVPGGSVAYTIVAANAGPSDDPSVSVTDTFPADLSCAWTSTAAGGASGNTAAGSGDLAEMLSMPAASSVTYTASCTIDPGATGALSNTATVSGSVTDPISGNNAATDGDTVLGPLADVSITKDDGVTSAIPGQDTLTYTIVASNDGPSDDPSVSVTDTFPADLTCTYTSVAVGGASGNTSAGASDLADTLSMPAASSVTYTATCTIDPGATGALSNTATVAGSVSDPNGANDSATDANTVLAPEADVSITKDDGVTSAIPGQDTLTYTIVASNDGPSDDPSVSVTDTFPADLTCTYTSVAVGGASGNTAAGSGDLADPLSMPAASSVTYTASCTIDPAANGTLSNTAIVSGSVTDPISGNNSATDADTVLTPQSDLVVTKTDSRTIVNPGDSVTYTITIAKSGPSDAPGTLVNDVFPAALNGVTWTCTATPGSTCAAAGVGDIAEAVDLAAGGSITFAATGSIDPAFVGDLINTADAAPGPGVVDLNPANNASTDTTTVVSPSDLSGTMEVAGDFREGGLVTYAVQLVNASPTAQLDNPGDELFDQLPPELTVLSASASSGTATVDPGLNTASWNGSIPGSGTIDVTIDARINYGAGGSTISNQGTVFFDADGDGSNESSVSTGDPAAGGAEDPTVFRVLSTIEIPTVADIGLVLLALLIAAVGLRRIVST